MQLYRSRNLIERFFRKLKHFRRIATRYENSPTTSYHGPTPLKAVLVANNESRA